MSEKRSSGTFMVGLLVGAAVGTLAGLLTAPRSGRETRHLLRKSANALPDLAEDLSTTVQMQADKLSTTAVSKWDVTLNRLRDAIAAGVEATQQEQQTLNQRPTTPQPDDDAANYDDRYAMGEID
jgi:gas vesicle protein